jgi:hypothetical protein
MMEARVEFDEADSLEELTSERIRKLLELVSNWLTEAERSDIQRLIWAGEPVVAFECLCGALSDHRVTVSSSVIEQIRRLGSDLDADMTFCDGISEEPHKQS